MKIMLLVLHKLREDISKVIGPSISRRNFFYTHELQESQQIDVKQIQSINNLADLFTKSLPTSTFEKLVYVIGMRRVHKMQD